MDHVHIITCNTALKSQLVKDTEVIIPLRFKNKIQCLDSSSMTTFVCSDRDVVLIDEYDKTLEYLIKISFSANSYRLYGLSSIVKA